MLLDGVLDDDGELALVGHTYSLMVFTVPVLNCTYPAGYNSGTGTSSFLAINRISIVMMEI